MNSKYIFRVDWFRLKPQAMPVVESHGNDKVVAWLQHGVTSNKPANLYTRNRINSHEKDTNFELKKTIKRQKILIIRSKKAEILFKSFILLFA